ncbi:MAG: sigma-70 family RNA polymerase sigma factor [Planctomycetes bacterium]|nr:sigma-70 family RNA polymerase sigma factor [Planctomycetota bacterium]
MVEKTPTQDLVERAQAGDKAAFDELVVRHAGRVRASIGAQVQPKSGLSLDPDEILQETFLRAFQSIGRFRWRGEDSFCLWLCGIARNVLLKQVREARRSRLLESPEYVPARGASPSTIMRRNERMDRLADAIAELPAHYREVLRLSRLDGLKVKEIAARTGRSAFSVRHLLARAILELRRRFGDTESLHLPDRSLRMEGDEDDA